MHADVPPTRRDELIAEITARLRRFCPDWPDDRFVAMVEQVAAATLKYEGHCTPTEYELEQQRLRAYPGAA